MPEGGFRITEVWAFLAHDGDDDEGVLGFQGPDGAMLPMIGADPTRIEGLRPLAERIAGATGHSIVLAHFTNRTDEEVVPKKNESNGNGTQQTNE